MYIYRYLFLGLLVGFFPLYFVHADENKDPCRELLKDESDLDKVYELSDMVFIAEITPRPGINPQIYNYRVYKPVLKGQVPEQGFITFAGACKPRASRAVYVFFLDSLKEKIQGFNSVFMSLPDGPGYTWIADWIDGKIGKSGARSQESE